MTEVTEPPRGEQVDDVLAAIRRLVSAEEQERRRAAPKRNEGSLILTNEMRIDVQDSGGTATMTERRPANGGLKASIDSPVERPAAPAPSERRRMGVSGRAEERADRTPALAGDDLAELVRSIVREELQGELGERISNNIRKLVRREIGRAIAARMGGG
ncbi:MAG: hypothetical protein AAGE13_01125 [Pseudomonadota bacterium]